MPETSRTDDAVAKARRRLRVLIVDDHLGTREALQLLMRHLKCHSDVAEDGREALEAVRSREYDVILMDVVMPYMDGLEATRWIRRERDKGPLPRIVGISADCTPADQELCFAAGMDEFLSKPIDVESLIRALDDVALGLVAAL